MNNSAQLHTLVRFLILLFLLILLQSCSSYKIIKPEPIVESNFLQHAQSNKTEYLSVNTAILTKEESYATFGVPLKLIGVQALWVSVENTDKKPYWLLYPAIDPDYFSPDEVAYAFAPAMSDEHNYEFMQQLRQLAFKNPVHPGEKKSGFIFVNLDEDYKEIDIELLGNNKLEIFNFLFTVNGLNYQNFYDILGTANKNKYITVDEKTLETELNKIACCTTNIDSSENGDPLNLVFIGNAEDLFPAFAHRGWHPAEKNYMKSAIRTIKSFLFGHHYRYSPVSPLYALGRKQDIALQKARGTIHQRQHLRLWLTPLLYKEAEGKEKSVWIGQVSRDIGVRFTSKTPILVTHKIDPDIDEARNELIQEMLFSGGLTKVGFTEGVPVSTPENPAYNLTGDPYFNDGLRAVLLMTKQPATLKELKFFDWEHPTPDARHFNKSYRAGQ